MRGDAGQKSRGHLWWFLNPGVSILILIQFVWDGAWTQLCLKAPQMVPIYKWLVNNCCKEALTCFKWGNNRDMGGTT